MKVSLNWAQQYSNVDLQKIGTEKLLEKIGAQVGAIEEVKEWGPRYEGIVVIRIVDCQPHPDADKLQLCTIDDGGVTKHVARDKNGHVQLVCGGVNARKGLLTAWIPPGATVPATLDKDPLVLEVRHIRGVPSPGMLATAHELGLSDDHSKLLEIDPAEVGDKLARPGTAFKKLYNLDDTVVDIENKMFTHRPDLFGILGVARELAGIQQLTFKSPNWYSSEPRFQTQSGLPFKVKVDNPKVVPRFMAVAIDNVTIGPSPVWMQAGLTRVGIRPINNVVDATNFVMQLTGQPMHAFDYHKLKERSKSGVTIGTRFAKDGEALTLLGGKKLKLTSDDIVLTTDSQAVDLAGIMGGAETEVDEKTQAILLTVTNFDMYAVRRASMRHGIFTDAATRNTKHQSPLQNDRVLAYALELLTQVTGGQQASKVEDVHRRLIKPAAVNIDKDFINDRLGTTLSLKDIATMLENVEFNILSVPADKKRLHVQSPFWRTDIEIPEDIVEEVGRLHGYDQLPLELPKRSVRPIGRNEFLDFKDRLRQLLSAAGANEVLTYSFVHGNLLERVGQQPKQAFQLSNALSPELQYYRLSLLPSLLEKVHPNLKSDRIRGENNEFALFEINPVHAKDLVDDDGLPVEDQRLALVFAADDKTYQRKYAGAPYFVVQHYANELLTKLGIATVFDPAKDHHPTQTISQAAIAPFDKQRSAIIKTTGGEFIGEIGELNQDTRRNLKLPVGTAGFELDVRQLMKLSLGASVYRPMSRFPKVMQDMTLSLPSSKSYGEAMQYLEARVTELKPEDTSAVLGLPRIYQASKQQWHLTLRLWISHFGRTMKTEEVSTLLDAVAQMAQTDLGAERV